MTRNLILLLSVACLIAVALLTGERVLSGTSEEDALAADARAIMQTLPPFLRVGVLLADRSLRT